VLFDNNRDMGLIMLIQLPTVSPMYAAYVAQKQQIDAAIEFMVENAAAKLGNAHVQALFTHNPQAQKQAA